MKKRLLIILLILLVLVLGISIAILNSQNEKRLVIKYNNQFIREKNIIISGTDLASIINKAVDTNEKNLIKKSDDKTYIENDLDSIKIYINLMEDGQYYSMERIYNKGITEFVKNFNFDEFCCSKVVYHIKTGKVKEVYYDIIL